MNGLTKLSDYFQKKLESIEIKYADSLFEPDWKMLLENRCPVCSTKLYRMRNKPRWNCKSKKNRHTFTISEEKLLDYKKKHEKV